MSSFWWRAGVYHSQVSRALTAAGAKVAGFLLLWGDVASFVMPNNPFLFSLCLCCSWVAFNSTMLALPRPFMHSSVKAKNWGGMAYRTGRFYIRLLRWQGWLCQGFFNGVQNGKCFKFYRLIIVTCDPSFS